MHLTTDNFLVVEVTANSWGAFGKPSPESEFLLGLLNSMGGISDTVPAGTYHFSAEPLDGDTYAAHLEPAS